MLGPESVPSAADEARGIRAPLPLQHAAPSQSQDGGAGKSWSLLEENHGKVEPGCFQSKEDLMS